MERTRASWLIWAAVTVGLLLRGYHYGRGPAVWHDEAALLMNVIRLPVADSFGPLLQDEASPPLFLLLEKAVAAVLGDGEYALRLPSFLAACAAVVFTAFAARRMLPPVWAAIAVGLVAVSDRLLFHACEAKWYSLDVCVAAGAIWAVVATARRPVWAQCLVAAAVAPVCIWISFPACFVCGGVLVAWLPSAWRAGWGVWRPPHPVEPAVPPTSPTRGEVSAPPPPLWGRSVRAKPEPGGGSPRSPTGPPSFRN